MPALYNVTTYDYELEEYTPQIGLPKGPFKLWELRGILRRLSDMGYPTHRSDGTDILIEKVRE